MQQVLFNAAMLAWAVVFMRFLNLVRQTIR